MTGLRDGDYWARKYAGDRPPPGERASPARPSLGLEFGATADPLRAQLAAQALHLDYSRVYQFQADADAITRLFIRGLLPESLASRCRFRLLKMIAKQATPSKGTRQHGRQNA